MASGLQLTKMPSKAGSVPTTPRETSAGAAGVTGLAVPAPVPAGEVLAGMAAAAVAVGVLFASTLAELGPVLAALVDVVTAAAVPAGMLAVASGARPALAAGDGARGELTADAVPRALPCSGPPTLLSLAALTARLTVAVVGRSSRWLADWPAVLESGNRGARAVTASFVGS